MKRVMSLVIAFALCCSAVTAQPGRGGRSRPGTPGSSTLERAGVKLGQPLPKIAVFDEKGAKFRLADIKEKYTVIVFGCLT